MMTVVATATEHDADDPPEGRGADPASGATSAPTTRAQIETRESDDPTSAAGIAEPTPVVLAADEPGAPDDAIDDVAAADDVASGGDDDGAGDEAEDEAEEVLYTIDELASLSGVPSRTIRFYQSKGTLPAPERRGRVAYYRAEHIDRLKVIAELQDRGLRLDAIRDALQQLEQGGDSLHEWLGMGDELQAPWSDDRPIVVTETELLAKLGNRLGMLAELRRVGMIERQGNSRPATYIVPSPGLLEIGMHLDAAGVDAITAYEASETMRRPIAKMSDDLVQFFAERAGQGFGGHGEPHEIARAFEALRPEGLRAVQLIFAQEIERSLREFVERGGAMPQTRKPRSRSKSPDKRTERKSERKPERRDHRDRHTGRADRATD